MQPWPLSSLVVIIAGWLQLPFYTIAPKRQQMGANAEQAEGGP